VSRVEHLARVGGVSEETEGKNIVLQHLYECFVCLLREQKKTQVQVVSVDFWERQRVVGYGYVQLPDRPGIK
jgi:hypothetical protein